MIVNAHTHLYSGLRVERRGSEGVGSADGRVKRVTGHFGSPAFGSALVDYWWKLDRVLDRSSLRAAARLYAAEARLAGTDALIDHHESPNFIEGSLDVVADACAEMGVSALLCYGATERNGGASEAQRGLQECRRFIETNRRPGIRGAVGLHAAFTVSDDTLRAAGRLCRELEVPLHVHVAEDTIDRDGFARLVACDALVPRSILAHGVHLTEAEVRHAESLGCWIVQNPRSNEANRVGYASRLRASTRIALGTDGFPSDLRAEAGALCEDESIVAARLTACETLARELGLHESVPRAFDIVSIRADAVLEGEILWEKMNERHLVDAGDR